MSDSVSSTVEGEQVLRSPTLLQNIQPSSNSQASTLGMCSLTLSGENLISLGLNSSSNEFRNAWILNSGATDHMTHNPNQFKTYLPCPSNRKIVVADGTTTTVASIGDVQVTSNLVLKNVLHVPQLSTNLVSIQKLTQDLSYRVIFDASFCEFQDQGSRRKIGLAKEHNGLYFLSTSSQPKLLSLLSTSFFSSSNKDVIWLHHRRLGHVHFSTLKLMFPTLFKGLDIQHFHCNICEY